MKIPVATRTKSDKETIKPSQIATINQFSNLSDVLQAQCRRITLLKHEGSSRESSRSLDHRIPRQGVISETYHPSFSRIQTAKPCKSVHGNRDVTQTYDLCLPQVASAMVVKSPPTVSKSSVSVEYSGSPKSFIMPNYNTRAMYGGSSTQETKMVKVFLSEKHSGTMKDCGMEFPCAPPVTPTPGKIC